MKSAVSIRQQIQVCIGKAGAPVGTLVYVKRGRRENTTFAYDQSWLANPDGFNVSADLALHSGYQPRRAPSAHDSVFHFAIADTAPDAWGRRVIARDHARRRKENAVLAPLTELDYLLAVDDFSRVGALRLRDQDGRYCRTVDEGRRSTPPLLELQRIYQASRAVEQGQESTEDLRYLQGKGTSLGGMRPKSTVVDEDGALAIGKFPSVGDTRSVTRGEVLALCLAQRAGIDAAPDDVKRTERFAGCQGGIVFLPLEIRHIAPVATDMALEVRHRIEPAFPHETVYAFAENQCADRKQQTAAITGPFVGCHRFFSCLLSRVMTPWRGSMTPLGEKADDVGRQRGPFSSGSWITVWLWSALVVTTTESRGVTW